MKVTVNKQTQDVILEIDDTKMRFTFQFLQGLVYDFMQHKGNIYEKEIPMGSPSEKTSKQ